jgi:hypothetical protein
MCNRILIFLTIVIYLGCSTKNGQLNESELKAYFSKKELRKDTSLKITYFKLEHIDTLTQKEINKVCERRYLSFLRDLEWDTAELVQLSEFNLMMTKGLQSNMKKYLLTKIDSVRRLIPISDSLKPFAYYTECSYRISNDIGSKIGKMSILIDNDFKIVEDEDEYFGIHDIIWLGPQYSK